MSSSTRRTLLRVSGSLLASGFLAGCAGISGTSDTTPTRTTTEEPTSTTTTKTETEASDSRSCPPSPFKENGQTICDGKAQNTPVYLYAKNETMSAPQGTITFIFVNTSDNNITYGPCLWTLYKQTQQGWTTIRPLKGAEVGKILPAHQSVELSLHIGMQLTDESDCGPTYTTGSLDLGRYLFGIQGMTPDGTITIFFASFRIAK